MKDILAELANSSSNESSHDLQCRCFDAAEEISRLRAKNAALSYSLQLDEELICMIQKIISVLNSRPV